MTVESCREELTKFCSHENAAAKYVHWGVKNPLSINHWGVVLQMSWEKHAQNRLRATVTAYWLVILFNLISYVRVSPLDGG